MELLFIIWFFILPILGILTPIFGLLFWFAIVPPVSRMLAYNRFKNVSIHAIHDDAGYAELVPTKEMIPEGVERTKRGWRLLPRAGVNTEFTQEEKLLLRKYTLKGYGKPFWIGHAGKVVSMNGGALAGMQQTERDPNNPGVDLSEITAYLKTLPSPLKEIKKDLTKMLGKAQAQAKHKPYTLVDASEIKNVVDELYPPSMLDGFERNRIEKGRRMAGKQYTSLIIGAALILGIVVIGVVALFVLGG